MGLDCNAHASGDASAHLCTFNDLAGAILSLLGARRPRVLRAGTGGSADRFSGNVTLIYKSPIGSAKHRICKLQTRQPKKPYSRSLAKKQEIRGGNRQFICRQYSPGLDKAGNPYFPFTAETPFDRGFGITIQLSKDSSRNTSGKHTRIKPKKDQFNGNTQGTSRPTGRTGKTD
ncbi:hypothetical protein [Dokdonella sp.]|uniref:hypothetical protein n=1 Tax=Dokdonella sp. TaxID=2291710 RepID=UPI002DD686B1|nr:hypothetical protein [Dokdonella sp.]